MSFVVGLLLRFGVADAAAKKLAPFAAALAFVAFLGLLWGAVQVWDHFDDKAAIQQDRLEGNNAALIAQLAAEAAAARERLRNAETNRETERAYEDAILVPKSGDHPDPAVRLACEQLRRDGQDTTGLSECGRR